MEENNTTTLGIKLNTEIKDQLDQFADELGINTTALVNLIVRQTLRDRQISIDLNDHDSRLFEAHLSSQSCQCSCCSHDQNQAASPAITDTAHSKPELIAHLNSLGQNRPAVADDDDRHAHDSDH